MVGASKWYCLVMLFRVFSHGSGRLRGLTFVLNASPHVHLLRDSGIQISPWCGAWGEGLNTQERVQRRKPHLTLAPQACPVFSKDSKSVDHMLLHCKVASFIGANSNKQWGSVGLVRQVLLIFWSNEVATQSLSQRRNHGLEQVMQYLVCLVGTRQKIGQWEGGRFR